MIKFAVRIVVISLNPDKILESRQVIMSPLLPYRVQGSIHPQNHTKEISR